MHDLNKSLDDVARSIDRAEKKRKAHEGAKPNAPQAAPVDYEQRARDLAERELYAARYREQLMTESRDNTQTVDGDEPNVGDIPPRVTEIAHNEPSTSDSYTAPTAPDGRVLTIPATVYRISVEPQQYPQAAASDAAVPVSAYQTSEAPLTAYTEAVADEVTDDLRTYAPLPPYEPQSKISHPTVADAQADELHLEDADYGRAHVADDAGSYAAPSEYERNEPISSEPHPIGVPYDPSHEEQEYARFLAEQEEKKASDRTKKRVSLESDVHNLYLPVDAIDKNVRLVESRMLYEIESMKAQHRMLGYTFSSDVLKRERTERRLRRQINDRMYRLSRALKRERSDNMRYYTAALDRYLGDPEKRKSNAAVIETVLARLDYALKERDKVSDKLLALYAEATPGAKMSREMKVAEKAAKSAYRSQLKAAKRLARMHVPAELKDRIYSLMNGRINTLSMIEKNEYLLSKKRYTGADKRTVKRQNKDMKRAVRRQEDEIRDLMKRAEKHDESHGGGIRQIAWLVGTLVVLGAIGALYLLGKYYWGWF